MDGDLDGRVDHRVSAGPESALMGGAQDRMAVIVTSLDEDTGEEIVCRLVFPGEADITHMRVSILAPIGTAILGYRTGDHFEWRVPAVTRRLMIKDVKTRVTG